MRTQLLRAIRGGRRPGQGPGPGPGLRSPLRHALFAALIVTGCPHKFDPRADEIRSDNPAAESDYRRAQGQLQGGDAAGAEQSLRQFHERYGPIASEPLVPLASILQARALRGLGRNEEARAILMPLTRGTAPNVAEKARYELGLVQFQLGEFDEARALLTPFSGQIVDSEEATELHAALAELWRRAEQPAEALREYALFYGGVSVRALEQAYVRATVQPLIAKLPPGEQKGWLGRFGLGATAAPGDPRPQNTRPIVGLAVPLSGKDRALGERVLRGALWAAEQFGAERTPGVAPAGAAIDLRVRDTASSPEGAQAAATELVAEGAQVLIGSPAKAEAAPLAAVAERSGAVLLGLGPTQPGGAAAGSARAFQLLRPNAARAETLAQKLAGLESVAVLAPATPYGQAMTRAFLDAARRAAPPVQVVAQLTFAENATTFTTQARELLAARPAALYVPASAGQLALIAAQLAASGVLSTFKVVTPLASDKDKLGPPVRLLLSSAEGMGEKLLHNAGRYLQGAVLAPVSVGGAPLAVGDAVQAARWDGYKRQVGAEPGALDALGYDAVLLVRTACERRPSCPPDAIAAALRALTLEGATGTLRFDAAGQRSGDAFLVRVEGSSVRPVR